MDDRDMLAGLLRKGKVQRAKRPPQDWTPAQWAFIQDIEQRAKRKKATKRDKKLARLQRLQVDPTTR